ncbi:MAG TPA: hypothetical protein GYA10_02165 [Alphaproteobacteria bacterium]|nr:hypothetical protein [Alphaproteobacteria bacterium]
MSGHAVVANTIVIEASPAAVWRTLTDPDEIARWYMGMRIETTWAPGEPLLISGTIGPKRYRDRGRVLLVEPERRLAYEWLPRISGLPDAPENYSRLTFTLAPAGAGAATELTVAHAVPPSPVRRGKGWEIGPESAEKHVAFWWRSTLPLLKAVAETAAAATPPG